MSAEALGSAYFSRCPDVDTYSLDHPFVEDEFDTFRPSRGVLEGLPVALTL
jgi:hypothetical protein